MENEELIIDEVIFDKELYKLRGCNRKDVSLM